MSIEDNEKLQNLLRALRYETPIEEHYNKPKPQKDIPLRINLGRIGIEGIGLGRIGLIEHGDKPLKIGLRD